MKIASWPTDRPIPYARNARKISPVAVDKVASSIKEFGWRQPIVVDGEGVVIAGHTRLLAARKLSLSEVPVHVAEGLSKQQVKAYRLMDNRSHEEAEWDKELLGPELLELEALDIDLALTGFDPDELSMYTVEKTEGLVDEDQTPEALSFAISESGDLWMLGNHRLLCGDSTSIDAVERLMDGQEADMVFTDPPYNIDYQGVKDKRDKIKNDKMPDGEFLDFLVRAIMPCDVMYICCSWQYAHLFKQAMTDLGYAPKAMIVWDKLNPAQHLDLYFKQHEMIFYHGPFGGQATVRGDVWQLKRQKNTVHPTMKPVELIETALGDHAGRRIIYDAFGGSGSTLIACEKTGRSARLMELDPKYCDVIVKRWQDFTGKEAHLEDGTTFAQLEAKRNKKKPSKAVA